MLTQEPLAMTDLALLQDFSGGCQDALGTLYRRYHPQVYRLAYRMLGNTSDAEDLTQEVFLTLWRKSYDPQRGPLGSYLNLVTRSRAIDRLRARGSFTKLVDKWQQGLVMESPPLPLEQLMAHEDCGTVRLALTKLPSRQRQVLEMAYYGGLSQAKIAATIQIPLGTVKTWTRQGLLTLNRCLQPAQ